MEVVQENNSSDNHEDAFSEGDAGDDYQDPELLPRVGDQYQVEIPPPIFKLGYFCFSSLPTEPETSARIGLPISLMWIKVEDIKQEPLDGFCGSTDVSECNRKSELFSDGYGGLKPKVEPMDVTLDGDIKLGVSSNIALPKEVKNEVHQKHSRKGYRLVPGSAGDTWSDIDEASFLLGLYIFGKNFVQVKKFVETKEMGEILYFYYGKFYGSEKYRRWSECRKPRSRKCVDGQRIFTGLRQQELLSRLLLRVSDECKKTILEDTKAFGEGKMSFEQYVFALRATVGLNALVEAVGIGKRKLDLTGMAAEHVKSNHVVPARPEIPTGKACSMLTPLEIVNFLTGGYRLSKARSSELFWEAVWPRLLARGWHSEQPNNHGCAAGSKHSLVFLVPGIKKFRKKLKRGNHYFDSVSDVLSKVAKDPGLLELESGADTGDGSKEENGWTNGTKPDKEDIPDQQRHCYLKPKTPNRGMDGVKFTVVDTSLANGGRSKIRELRSLPDEMRNAPTSRSHSEDSEGDTSDESTDESDSSDNMGFDRDKQNGFEPTKLNFDKNASNGGFTTSFADWTNPPAVRISDHKSDICNDVQPRRRAQLSKARKLENNIHLAPVTKRRRKLTANRSETINSTINALASPRLNQDEARYFAGNPDFTANISFQMDQSHEMLSSTNSSYKGSPIASGEGTLSSACSIAEHAYQKPRPRRDIDLNLPIPPDAEADELFTDERVEEQHDLTSRQPDDSSAFKACENVATSEQQPNMNSRRQSTRNRPLSAKALEALALGYFTTKPKRKHRDDCPRPSRRDRGKVRITENLGGSTLDFQAEEKGNGTYKDNVDMFSEHHD